MHENHLWNRAKNLEIQTGPEIVGGFSLGFDRRIPEEIREELTRFVYWVEDYFSVPVTLWVDFKHKHYLLDENKKWTPYRFYWVDYESLANFDSFDDIPVIELAARGEKQTLNVLLSSLIDAISHYYAWLSGEDMKKFQPDQALTEEILRKYQNT
jgi:hypothetical protein